MSVSTGKIYLDVREPLEYRSGHVAEALNISLAELMQGTTRLNDVPRDTQLVVYCRSGSRSGMAIQILQGMGYSDLTNGISPEYIQAHNL